MAAPQIDDARKRIQEALGESLLVEASAGTGKTTALTERMVALLRTGQAQVPGMVAVTFTNRAAGELKLRLRQALDDARSKAQGVERDFLEDALAHLEEAFVGTIHAFCVQILRQRPVEASIDPDFTELTEAESHRIFEEVFRRWFHRRLAAESPVLRRALARLSWPAPKDDRSPLEKLKAAARMLADWRDYRTPWSRPLFGRAQEIEPLVQQARALVERAAHPFSASDPLYQSLSPIREFLNRLNSESDWPGYSDTVEALLVRLEVTLRARDYQKAGQSKNYGPGVDRPSLLQDREQFKLQLSRFAMGAGAELAPLLRDEFQALLAEYDDAKRRAGKLDFLDQLLLARDLIRDHRDVREYFQRQFTHLFVDEFQDTDPLQLETLFLLAADDPSESDWRKVRPVPGKLFLVGDPKQSIYRFRRADVGLYQAVTRQLQEANVGFVRLETSYRAVENIQRFVNACFGAVMTGDDEAAQADYHPLGPHASGRDSQPSVIALPPPFPYGSRNLSRAQVEACLPSATGAFVKWLIEESGWRVRDPERGGEWVSVQPHHVCLLFRRFTSFGEDVTRGYVHALEERGVSHLLVGSKAFHRREEVETLRAALTAIEWPHDQLAVYATLRGALFGVDDASLYRYRQVAAWHPLAPRAEGDAFAEIRAALDKLAELHRRRNRRPVADTLQDLLQFTRAHAAFALRPSGHQVLANVNRLTDLARNFEVGGGLSFRGFVDELTRLADRADSTDAPIFEYAAEGVRLMTVHNAKGLEFPVVILADPTAHLEPFSIDRYVDPDRNLCAVRLLDCTPDEVRQHEARERLRETAEGQRVAYVAATRARDLLVIPAVGDEWMPGWLDPLGRALYPPSAQRRRPQAANGCPPFGEATVLNRPDPRFEEPSVRPGLHRLHGYEVVWWDPRLLTAEPPAQTGLRQNELLQDTGAVSTQAAAAYRRWKSTRTNLLAEAAAPSLAVVNPSLRSAHAGAQWEQELDPQIARAPRADQRPTGRRYGTLVHALLRDAPWDAGRAEWQQLARIHGAALQAPSDEQAAAIEAAEAAWAHPLLQRARASHTCYREYPVTVPMGGGVLMEGAVDLVFLEGGRAIAIDYKTTGDWEAHAAEYSRQMRGYAWALRQVTGQTPECWILCL